MFHKMVSSNFNFVGVKGKVQQLPDIAQPKDLTHLCDVFVLLELLFLLKENLKAKHRCLSPVGGGGMHPLPELEKT